MNRSEPITSHPRKIHELARWLESHLADIDPCGYVQGKTAIRDLICRELGTSMAEAEDSVDALVASGALRFEGDPTTAGFEPNARWIVHHPVTRV